jgi:3-deoxy-manno-octulosonate cytidylyltransferase (CMP-KDO synthetase)
VVLTRADHPSGSDRLAEACSLLGLQGDDLVVNVQGDEPLIDPALIDAVATLLRERPQASMSTAAHPIASVEEFTNPNVVKVVLQADGIALYFSRAPLPWWRDGNAGGITPCPSSGAAAPHRHLRLPRRFPAPVPALPQAPVESCEALEQLRALWHGHRIAVHVTEADPGAGVDTPEDLERVRKLFSAVK